MFKAFICIIFLIAFTSASRWSDWSGSHYRDYTRNDYNRRDFRLRNSVKKNRISNEDGIVFVNNNHNGGGFDGFSGFSGFDSY